MFPPGLVSVRCSQREFVAYDQIESGLNDNGPFLASLVGLDRIENWAGLAPEAKRTRKERWMDRIIADLDRQYSGIAGAIVQREMSTAETFHQYLNTPVNCSMALRLSMAARNGFRLFKRRSSLRLPSRSNSVAIGPIADCRRHGPDADDPTRKWSVHRSSVRQ